MWGAIIGDIIGSTFENENHRSPYFELFKKQSRFTDDTVTSLATLDSLFKYYPFNIETEEDSLRNQILISDNLRIWSCCYFNRGFGSIMQQWITNGINYSYNSQGKAALTRLSCIPLFAINKGLSKEELLSLTDLMVNITHDNQNARNAGKAYTSILYEFLMFEEVNKRKINKYDISVIIMTEFQKFNIPTPLKLDAYRVNFDFDLRSTHILGIACAAILETDNFYDVMFQSVSVGGCSDTIASIAGSMAEAIYQISDFDKSKALSYFNTFDEELVNLLNKLYVKEDEQQLI